MKKSKTGFYLSIFIIISAAVSLEGCSHAPSVQTQAYAKLNDHHTFEYDFPVVWKGIESAMKNLQVVSRDPKEVGELEMRKINHRSLETDWIYTQSRDKYEEYQTNGSPRKVYLQTRLKYRVDAKRTLGGVDVIVRTQEEIERLNSDGTSADYQKSDNLDPSRPSELLDRINGAILAAVP